MGNNLMRPCEQEFGDDGEEELLFNRKYSVVGLGSRRRKAFCNYSLVRCWENNDRKATDFSKKKINGLISILSTLVYVFES